jgi:broad specificity phosphatase PhoE
MPQDVAGRIVLVRHAMPAVLPGVPAELWELGKDGRAAARALATAVPLPAYFAASDEPKALQTLQEMAGGELVIAEPGFREVRRPSGWSHDYRDLARAYVQGASHEGWEPHAEVAARFERAVARHARAAARRRQLLVVGTHGLAATVWLASRMLALPDPGTFWAGLQFPDLIEVDLRAGPARRRPR